MDQQVNPSPWAVFKADSALRRAQVMRLYQEGKRVQEIADQLGICRQRVYQILGPTRKAQPGSVPQ